MSGISSFLFQGQPVPPQPTGSDVNTTSPLWLQQFNYNLANTAANLANSPYTAYPGQQIATPSAATTQAQNMALGNVGNYQGALNGAMTATQNAATPIGADQINKYMSPYTNDVVGALQNASNTNLFTNVLPQVQDRFVGAGQSRSPQEMQATNNAVYQSGQALDQATAQALQAGYGQALTTATDQQKAQLAGGAQLGNLGALTQQLGAGDIGSVAAVGAQQDQTNQAGINAAMNNFYSQQQWPYQNLAYASDITRGLSVPSNVQTVGQQPSSQTTYSASPLQAFAQGVGVSGATGLNSLGLKAGGHVSRGALNEFREAA